VSGHDLHGLTRGPDGRIYLSFGDRGLCLTNREGVVINLPDTGGVLRCEPDGRRLELFCFGLRNPQELAFDDDGQLWTADNNGDGGDKARWTLVLPGSEHGWTIGWQWLPKMGAWNSERLWHTQPSNTALFLLPPVAHIGHGPAGIAYYPGTGLGDRFKGSFFYADFPGGVRHFRVEPVGAFYRIPDAGPWMENNKSDDMQGKLLWDLYPVDVAFPPGGGVVVADWIEGWEKTGKGRLWHVVDPALAGDARIAEVGRLLGEGMARRPEKELATLLGHRDQRIRLEAQWAAIWGTEG
jgi:quinoprotein glucose dehydrogenase